MEERSRKEGTRLRRGQTHRNLPSHLPLTQGKFLGSLWPGFLFCKVGTGLVSQGVLRHPDNWDKESLQTQLPVKGTESE